MRRQSLAGWGDRGSNILGLGWGLMLPVLAGVTSPGWATPRPEFHRFADWCQNQNRLTAAQQHTIQILLQKAGHQDCQAAEQALSRHPQLDLINSQITDISPLTSLTHLQQLSLSVNQIRDISPLAQLPQLSFLLLDRNQIVDVSPLANLTQLNYLVLDQNQITEVTALAKLTHLRSLMLMANPLTAKTCPVQPAHVCIFSDDGQELYAQAETHYQQGQFQAAWQQLQTVLAIYTKGGDRVKQGNTLNRLGDTALQLGQYAQSLVLHQQALELRQTLDDRQGIGVSLTSLAKAYEQLGQYQKASETLEQAVKNLHQQQQGSIPLEGGIYELPKDEAVLRNRLALVQNKQDNPQAALASAQKARSLSQLLPEGYPGKQFIERTVLDTIGVTQGYLGHSRAALITLQDAVTLAQAIGDRAGEAASLNHLGEVYLNLGNYPQAINLFQQTSAIYRAIADKPGEGSALSNLGLALLQHKEFPQATQTLLAAIQIWEALRPGLTDDTKVSLVETQLATYSHLQQALIAQKQPEDALAIAERSRARAFVELLASRLGAKVSQQFDSPTPLSVAKIRQIAKTHQATLVEYSIVQDQLLIWVIEPNGVITLRSVKLPALKKSLAKTAEQSRMAAATERSRGSNLQTSRLNEFVRGARDHVVSGLSGSQSSPSSDPQNELPPLQQSYQLLIAPIADLLPQDPQAPVIFIPQGALFLIPFPALQAPNGKYLIETHTMLTAPSIQVLELTHQHQLTTDSSSTLVVGNPTMPHVSFALGEAPQSLASLPGAETEAIAVADLLNSHPLIGNTAQETTVVERMKQARIVHLATHGLLDDLKHLGLGTPGAIALAPAASTNTKPTIGNSPTDGLLTTNEVLDLQLKAELVVLSACNTGRGTITGDGVIGLSRSFLAAGVSRVLVSLWEVPDEPTSTLMIEFYRQMNQTSNKAHALRQAMLTTMEQYPNPNAWAAFTLIGLP